MLNFQSNPSILGYIDGDLTQNHQVSRRTRRKDTLSREVLEVLLRCDWVHDTSTYNHERLHVKGDCRFNSSGGFSSAENGTDGIVRAVGFNDGRVLGLGLDRAGESGGR